MAIVVTSGTGRSITEALPKAIELVPSLVVRTACG
jgi:hypothetical protein